MRLGSRAEAQLSSEKSLGQPSQEVAISEAAERPMRDSPEVELELLWRGEGQG